MWSKFLIAWHSCILAPKVNTARRCKYASALVTVTVIQFQLVFIPRCHYLGAFIIFDLGLLSYFAHCLEAFIMAYINVLELISCFASTEMQ
jgi:hypothetical protein